MLANHFDILEDAKITGKLVTITVDGSPRIASLLKKMISDGQIKATPEIVTLLKQVVNSKGPWPEEKREIDILFLSIIPRDFALFVNQCDRNILEVRTFVKKDVAA